MTGGMGLSVQWVFRCFQVQVFLLPSTTAWPDLTHLTTLYVCLLSCFSILLVVQWFWLL